MAVYLTRSQLSVADKAFIREHLVVVSRDDPPVTIRPLQVHEEEVRLPLAFYTVLRESSLHPDWPPYPNDALHPHRFQPEWQFTGTLKPDQQAVWAETLPILRARRSVLGSLYCGWGKTPFACWVASQIQLVTLVLYHVSPLGESWPSSFRSFGNARVCHLGQDAFDPKAQVYISTVGGALSANFPIDPRRIGFLVIDEAHCFCSPKRILSLLQFQPKYLLLLTATPHRRDGLGKLIDIFNGELRLDAQGQPVPDQVPTTVLRVSQKPFTVYKQETKYRPVIKSHVSGKGLDWQVVKNSLLPLADKSTETQASREITEIICDWVVKNPNRKILIVCIQISQVLALELALRSRGEEVGTYYGSKQTTYDDCRTLVANVQKVGVGFDDARTCRDYRGQRFNMVILAWSYKDQITIEQIVGRMRGEGNIVVDLVHNFSSFTKHFTSREEWYLGHGGEVEEVEGPRLLT